ncbi:MAG: transporter substrate-binding domain-containing protein [Chlamydiota bacterium]
MRKKIIILFCFFIQGIYGQNYAPDIQQILNRGVLSVGMIDEQLPPFHLKDKEGNWVGIDIDISRELASSLGVKLEIRFTKTFKEVIDLVFSHQVDVGISNLSRTLKRSQKVLFSDPYALLHKALLVNRRKEELIGVEKEGSVIERLNHSYIKIAYTRNSADAETFADLIFPGAQKIEYENQSDLMASVEKGEVAAGLVEEMTMKLYSKTHPEKIIDVQPLLIRDVEDPVCIALPWDSRQLLFYVSIYLKNKKVPLDVDKYLQKYEEVLLKSNK